MAVSHPAVSLSLRVVLRCRAPPLPGQPAKESLRLEPDDPAEPDGGHGGVRSRHALDGDRVELGERPRA